ncbi:MAG: peptidoglycan DD-metalloendopeptidase family protein [Oscillospiraceae bacterium]|nr:peptidoglycan DD-metalloendopeptidase family protein [Oscillospiraceae bacterium]
MKKAKKYILVLLILAVCFSSIPLSAFAAVSQSQIDEVKRKRDQVYEEKQAQQEIIDELSASRDDIISQKMALEEKVTMTREQIALNNQEIELYEDMIAEKQEEVVQAKALEDLQLERYRARIRAMEENGQLDLFVLLSESQSISDLLTALDDAGDIMQSDRALEDQYIAARKAHEAKKDEYEEYKAGLVAIQEMLSDERDQLELDIEFQQQIIDELQQQISENEDLIAEINARWAELDQEVVELQEKYDEQHTPGSLWGAAGLIWPCGAYYITSLAGNRIHPVTGESRYHSGIDIGVPNGDPIWAAAAGTVTMAGWNGNYGNCVMVTHGNGYTTVYGHLSGIAVSYGQSVNMGQTIGYCGSTGLTTGPHLHFEIREGGSFLNPMDFFGWGNFDYAPDA